jgi:hypothetical protein
LTCSISYWLYLLLDLYVYIYLSADMFYILLIVLTSIYGTRIKYQYQYTNSGKLQFESKGLSDVMHYLSSIGLFCGISKSLYVVNKDLLFCVCHVEILHRRILFTKYKPVNSIPIASFISTRIWKYATLLESAVKRVVCCVCSCVVLFLCISLRSYRLLNLTSL